ncbi:MAG: hypothetical protein QXQ50_03800 [Candidatus Bathyarchaeia archaeon]
MPFGEATTVIRERGEARENLEKWGNFIVHYGLFGGIVAIVLVTVLSVTLARGQNFTLASVSTVVIMASLAIAALVIIPLGLVVWGIVKICEEG